MLPPAAAYWAHADWLAILLIAIIAVRLHELVPPLRVLKPAFTTGVIGFGFLLTRTRPAAVRSLFANRTFRLVLAYFAWAAIGVPFALWIGLAANQLLVFLPAMMLVASILLCAPTMRNLESLQAGYVGAAGIAAVALFTIGRGERLELPGSYDTNDTAALLALCLPFALGLIFHGRGRRRWIGVAASALLAAGVVGTGSRGGTLALLSGVLVFVLGLRGGRKFLMMFAAMGGAVVLWSFAPVAYRERMIALAEGQEDYNQTSYAGRTQIWARARVYIVQHPVLGVGIGNFPVAEGDYLALSGRHGKWSAAHNSYLQSAAELGIPGGLLFLCLVVTSGRRAYPSWRVRGRDHTARLRHRPELLASVSAFAVGSFFLSHAYSFAFFALIGLVELGARVAEASGSVALQGRLAQRPGRDWRPGRTASP